jgi:hypothetical protein
MDRERAEAIEFYIATDNAYCALGSLLVLASEEWKEKHPHVLMAMDDLYQDLYPPREAQSK